MLSYLNLRSLRRSLRRPEAAILPFVCSCWSRPRLVIQTHLPWKHPFCFTLGPHWVSLVGIFMLSLKCILFFPLCYAFFFFLWMYRMVNGWDRNSVLSFLSSLHKCTYACTFCSSITENSPGNYLIHSFPPWRFSLCNAETQKID